MTLKLSDLEAPLDDVEFPDGSVHKPTPFGKAEYALWRNLQTETDATKRGTMLMQIIRGCYPTATEENIESCTVRMLWAMIAHAARKIDQVRDALKNADAVAPATEMPPPQAAPITPPSSRMTSGATSSRKSRKRSGKTGGTSTSAIPTDGQNSSGSLSTISTSPGVSISFAESSTTSTAPI